MYTNSPASQYTQNHLYMKNVEADYSPNPDQTRTKIQLLQVQGGLALSSSPLNAFNIVRKYRTQFDAAYGVERRICDPEQAAYAKMMSASSLRRMIFNPFIFRSLPIASGIIEDIWDVTDSRYPGSVSYSSPDSYPAQRGRQLEGLEGFLAVHADIHLRGVAEDTMRSFSNEEMSALSVAFSIQTAHMKVAIREYLDITEPEWKKQINKDTNSNTFKNLPTAEYFAFRKLLNSSHDITTSFTNSSVATSTFIAERMCNLLQAGNTAGMPREEWLPLTYRKIRMLAIQSQLPDTESLHLEKPDYINPYIVFQNPDGSWDADIADDYQYIKKVYHDPKHRYKGCQGAAELLVADNDILISIGRMFGKLRRRTEGHQLDIDFNHTADAAHMFSLLAVTCGESLLST